MPKEDYMNYDKGGYIDPKFDAKGSKTYPHGKNQKIFDGIVSSGEGIMKLGKDAYKKARGLAAEGSEE